MNRSHEKACIVCAAAVLSIKKTGFLSIIFFLLHFLFPVFTYSQAVSAIITDYNGYWKTSVAVPNATKPMNNHNVLSFTYNGTQYSTGANDPLLSSHGETFSPQDFWSLPVEGISGTINGNTKVGVGQMYDGVHNGASNPPPENSIALYLTDGIKGLNIGTCIANLPVGSLTFLVANINPAAIGDGIPDILVTQIADPSGSFDRYEFIDENNLRVGNYKDIIFTNITPVGTWTADFYEASTNPMVLAAGFTNTDRPIRLWAADLSEFGITGTNYQNVYKFKINLSGNSDVAFAGYNNNSFQIANPLPVTLTDFKGTLVNEAPKLTWKTQTEINSSSFIIERSNDNLNFMTIGNIAAAGNSTAIINYHFTDQHPLPGINYYRLKMTDTNGKITYSPVIQMQVIKQSPSISIYPNPARDAVYINHPLTTGNEEIIIYNATGMMELRKILLRNMQQTKIEIGSLPMGIYYFVFKNVNEKISESRPVIKR